MTTKNSEDEKTFRTEDENRLWDEIVRSGMSMGRPASDMTAQADEVIRARRKESR